MSNISRRKFIYAGVGLTAAAGIGYFTKDYWLPQQEQILTPLPTSTPTISQSTQQTVTETPTPTLTETTTSTPIETTTTTEEMSEDELAVRKLLEEDWVGAFNSEDIQGMLDLYDDDDATVTTWMGQYVFGKDRNWSLYGYYEWSAKVNARVHNYKITMLKISGKNADVSSTYSYFAPGAGYNMTVTHQLKLIKITEITKGKVTTKLPKPIWKILYESVSF